MSVKNELKGDFIFLEKTVTEKLRWGSSDGGAGGGGVIL